MSSTSKATGDAASNAWFSDARDRPLIIAHRGANREAPENSLRAFQLGMERGADGVEFDVVLSKEGIPVVCHDESLSRVTQGRDTRRLRDLTVAELRQVNLGDGQYVPKLEEVLQWAVQSQALLNLELKDGQGASAELALAAGTCLAAVPGAAQLTLVSSFSIRALYSFRRQFLDVPCGALFEKAGLELMWTLVGGRRWLRAVHPCARLVNVESARNWRQQGKAIHVWDINDGHTALQFASLGVAALITDEPARLREAVR